MERNPMEKCLTNEILLKKKQFKSQFDLVNFAIKVAGDLVKSGRPAYFEAGEIQNPALEVLGQIAVGRERFQDIDFSEYDDEEFDDEEYEEDEN